MKLLVEYKKQIAALTQGGKIRRAWFTSFNCAIEFFETFILPATLLMDVPKTRLDYEALQKELTEQKIDLRIFCDRRMLRGLDNKRTAIDVYSLTPATMPGFGRDSLFHPKVIYLENTEGQAVIGAGSANLTISGWSRNQEVFAFHRIASSEQLRQVHTFFKEFIGERRLVLGKNFWGKDDSWRFVHSFQDELFLDALLNDEDDYLAVWSPYFPTNDLSGLIENIKVYMDLPDLKLLITPDRVLGKYIRTQWSKTLQAKIDSGDVSFYGSALEQHEQSELCHAKIWKTASSLAIGSWNFTGPGANVNLDSDFNWLEDNNVEAGFIYQNNSSIDGALGKVLNLQSDDFASEELLEQEALVLEEAEDLPFTLTVSFAWKDQQYTIEGKWLSNGIGKEYRLKLPDVDEFTINGRRSEARLGIDPIMPDCVEELLNQHNYIVYQDNKEVARGFILEREVDYRRVQTYESLGELFDALAMQLPQDNEVGTVVRSEINRDQELFAEDDFSVEVGKAPSASTSYFRLFQAMEAYRSRLSGIKKLDALEKVVFVYPGCLSEMRDKIDAKLNDGQDIFNWFLAQEYNQLVALAKRRYSDIRPKGKKIPPKPPAHKWGSLTIAEPKISKLKSESKAYLNLIRVGCGYA